ncbi:hypothetical protein HK1_02709 [Tepidibacillus sp. HK-1]|nr:hypothetical protein HK1_02709 [Tepidibacillus sp. HK-1]
MFKMFLSKVGGLLRLEHPIIAFPSENRIEWSYRREDSVMLLLELIEKNLLLLQGNPFVFLVDIRLIRYILPDDKKIIFQLIHQIKSHGLVGLAYLVDFRNYIRMQTLISLNQLPFKEVVFKREDEARKYLNDLITDSLKKCIL